MKQFPLLTLIFLLGACAPAPVPPLPPASPTPAPVSITAQPSVTPAPTGTFTPPAPTALPRFFAEEFDGALPAWSVLQSNGSTAPQTAIQDGALSFELGVPYQWAYAIVGSQSYDDVRLDALAQSTGTVPDALGLFCRYSEDNGWYEFNISGDGTYSVLFGQWLSEGVAEYTPVAADSSEYLKHGAQKNEIGLVCQDDTLLLYLNGKLFRKLDVSRFGLQRGKLGLAVASFENTPVLISFDWLKVSQP
jgi:hypothetical protein